LQELASKYDMGAEPQFGDFLMRFALADNPAGTVLASMFSADHVERNCQLSNLPASPSFVSELEMIIDESKIGHSMSSESSRAMGAK
jgi:hypothetical protein